MVQHQFITIHCKRGDNACAAMQECFKVPICRQLGSRLVQAAAYVVSDEVHTHGLKQKKSATKQALVDDDFVALPVAYKHIDLLVFLSMRNAFVRGNTTLLLYMNYLEPFYYSLVLRTRQLRPTHHAFLLVTRAAQVTTTF